MQEKTEKSAVLGCFLELAERESELLSDNIRRINEAGGGDWRDSAKN